jgi:AraC-like DNA-binding protein
VPARRVTSEEHAAAWGSWRLVHAEPAPHLRPYVTRYTGWWERTAQAVRRTEVPAVEVPVILSFGPPTLVHDPLRPEAPPARVTSFAAGLYARAVTVGHDGEGDAVQVDLTPLGARRFLGVPLRELAHRSVELSDLLGPAADRLVEGLALTRDWEARFDLLDAAVTRRVATGRPASPDVERAWTKLARSGGTIRVDELAADLRCSRRHLTARFHEEMGLPPKALARVLRFQRALALIRLGRDWARIAQACGYYDQPHLNREFRDLAGATPGELRARLLPDDGALRPDLIPFVQDASAASA